jgi:hypothetical protein
MNYMPSKLIKEGEPMTHPITGVAKLCRPFNNGTLMSCNFITRKTKNGTWLIYREEIVNDIKLLKDIFFPIKWKKKKKNLHEKRIINKKENKTQR